MLMMILLSIDGLVVVCVLYLTNEMKPSATFRATDTEFSYRITIYFGFMRTIERASMCSHSRTLVSIHTIVSMYWSNNEINVEE